MPIVSRKKWLRIFGQMPLKKGDVLTRFDLTPEEVLDGDEGGFVLNGGWVGVPARSIISDYDRMDKARVWRLIEKKKLGPLAAVRLSLNRRYAKPLPLP